MPSKQGTYAEASIRVLKGLEPVKQRPGMYTRTDNPPHLIQEVVDAAAPRKATAGECKHGTEARVWPDAKHFVSADLPQHELMHLLRSKAVPAWDRMAAAAYGRSSSGGASPVD